MLTKSDQEIYKFKERTVRTIYVCEDSGLYIATINLTCEDGIWSADIAADYIRSVGKSSTECLDDLCNKYRMLMMKLEEYKDDSSGIMTSTDICPDCKYRFNSGNSEIVELCVIHQHCTEYDIQSAKQLIKDCDESDD